MRVDDEQTPSSASASPEPASPPAETPRTPARPRRTLGEIATEALMVVFAVLAALGVEQWREDRQLQRFAERAREAVDLEIRQNLEEFQRTGPALAAKRGEMADALKNLLGVQRGEPSSGVELTFEWSFPDASSAAWRVAQSSPATPYFDYDWVLERSREYDNLARYQEVLNESVLALSSLSGSTAAGDLDEIVIGVQRLYGLLNVLVQLDESLQTEMETYLEA
ncbi:MAG: hypothetical protein OXH05_04090 [Acidobacteria bacterium]|nr:hypothetical protein [Acidobacteriota bacterium]